MTRFERNPAATPRFTIGRDANGFWAAKSADGREGGLFVSREEAVKYTQNARGRAVFARNDQTLRLWK